MRAVTSMWAVARRPRWIAMLVLALAVASGFAALGQWQLARSIASGTVIERDTETVKPLDAFSSPQSPVTEEQEGQLVESSGRFVSGDYSVISQRLNGGVEGYWVVGHLDTDPDAPGSAALAVALGWAPTAEAAASVAGDLDRTAGAAAEVVTGRYIGPDAPQLGDFEKGERSEMSTAALVNEWAGFDGRAYSGYVVALDPAPGLDAIDAPRPTSEVSVNWLNIFYAVEWAVFAVFAVFLWYRLVRDTWEREEEEAREADEGAELAAVGVPSPQPTLTDRA